MRIRSILVFGLAMGLAMFSMAQRPTERSTAASSPSSALLLWRPDVQTDLQLTGGEKAQLDHIRDRASNRSGRSFTPGTQNFRTNQTALSNYMQQLDQQCEQVLTDSQRSRLQQIKLQLRGPIVLLDPQIQSQLEVSDDQKAKMDAADQRRQAQMKAVNQKMRSRQIAVSQITAELRKVNADYAASLQKVLTAEQATKFKEMLGQPFHGAAS